VSEPAYESAREWAFFGESIDPLVDELLTFDDPWDAYRQGNKVAHLLIDTSPGGSFNLPHAGEVHVAWSELTDVYDTGKTPVSDAHATLRQAAVQWLERPAEPTTAFIEQWVADASQAVAARYERDCNWWHSPS
jgi:hypothetical protein